MKSRPEITNLLSLSIQKYINPHNDPRIYWAREVTFDYATNNSVRVDYIRFKPENNTVSGIEKGDFYCYECGRALKSQKSRELGYGPICYKKIFGNTIINRNTKKMSSGNPYPINYDIPGQMYLEDYLHNK